VEWESEGFWGIPEKGGTPSLESNAVLGTPFLRFIGKIKEKLKGTLSGVALLAAKFAHPFELNPGLGDFCGVKEVFAEGLAERIINFQTCFNHVKTGE